MNITDVPGFYWILPSIFIALWGVAARNLYIYLRGERCTLSPQGITLPWNTNSMEGISKENVASPLVRYEGTKRLLFLPFLLHTYIRLIPWHNIQDVLQTSIMDEEICMLKFNEKAGYPEPTYVLNLSLVASEGFRQAIRENAPTGHPFRTFVEGAIRF